MYLYHVEATEFEMNSPLLPDTVTTGTNTKMCLVHLSMCANKCGISFTTYTL